MSSPWIGDWKTITAGQQAPLPIHGQTVQLHHQVQQFDVNVAILRMAPEAKWSPGLGLPQHRTMRE